MSRKTRRFEMVGETFDNMSAKITAVTVLVYQSINFSKYRIHSIVCLTCAILLCHTWLLVRLGFLTMARDINLK